MLSTILKWVISIQTSYISLCKLLCDLHKRNITHSPYCSCGHIEDAYHSFFACNNYSRARKDLFNRLFSFDLDLVNIDTKLLLSGDYALTEQTNINILQLFINSLMKLVDLPIIKLLHILSFV
jgi:hypothetical protein